MASRIKIILEALIISYGIPSWSVLLYWVEVCVSVNQKAMPVGAIATDRKTQVTLIKG